MLGVSCTSIELKIKELKIIIITEANVLTFDPFLAFFQFLAPSFRFHAKEDYQTIISLAARSDGEQVEQ